MIPQDLADFSQDLKSARDPFAVFNRFVAKRGVKGSLYGFVSQFSDLDRLGFTRATHLRHTYSEEWEKSVGQSCLDNDASFHTMFQGASVVSWNPPNAKELWVQAPIALRRQFEFESDIGMVDGVSLVVNPGQAGFSGAGLWFETQRTPDHFGREWAEHGHVLTLALHMLDQAVRIEKPNQLIRLSPRQRECLQWLAHGLHPQQIADRLGIAPGVVEYHLGLARERLKAAHRDQAVVKAVTMGLISP